MYWKLSIPAIIFTAFMAWFAYDTAENMNTCQQQVVQIVNAKTIDPRNRQDFMGSQECAKMNATSKVLQAVSQSSH